MALPFRPTTRPFDPRDQRPPILGAPGWVMVLIMLAIVLALSAVAIMVVVTPGSNAPSPAGVDLAIGVLR